MSYPITILFTVIFACLIQGTMVYAWLTDHLYFTLQKMGSLGVLGLATTGLSIAYMKLLSSTVNKFWSLKTIFAALIQVLNFIIFLGFMYLVLKAWANQPLYID